MIAGMMAMDRVSNDRTHLLIFKFKKPSMTNWPAIVPDSVALCPEANRPNAQIYFPLFPKDKASLSPAVSKLISSLRRSSP